MSDAARNRYCLGAVRARGSRRQVAIAVANDSPDPAICAPEVLQTFGRIGLRNRFGHLLKSIDKGFKSAGLEVAGAPQTAHSTIVGKGPSRCFYSLDRWVFGRRDTQSRPVLHRAPPFARSLLRGFASQSCKHGIPVNVFSGGEA